MNPSYRFYRKCYRFARAVIGIFCRVRVIGAEFIREGAALVCANHSSNIDPFFIAFAFGIANQMHIIAKAELFKIPLVSPILKKLGMISVNRGMSDISTVKSALGYLKKGEKVGIFPEGRRVRGDSEAAAKTGAVKLAERSGAPIIPMNIQRKKRLFGTVTVVIGEPFIIEKTENRRGADDYALLADEMMERIKNLSSQNVKPL